MEPPLPFGNAAARWYYVLLKGLVERGHRVTALAACASAQDAERARELFPAPRYDLRCHPRPARRGLIAKWRSLRRPHSYVFAAALERDVAALMAREADAALLHLEHVWSGWSGLRHRRRALLTVQYLVEIDLAETTSASPLDWLRGRAIRRAERRLLRSFPAIATVSPRLTERVRAIAGHDNVHTVPLAFDLSLYPFEPDPPRAGPPVVGLIGSYAWQPTYDAAARLVTRLWPAIRAHVPDARLELVGRHAARALGRFAHEPGVTILDDVPDIAPHFRRTDVLVYAPPRGSGMKVKVMEAFAYGTPVVANTEGVEGIPAVDGVHVGLAEDDAGLVERTTELLRRADLRRRRREAARRLVEQHCDPARVLDLLEQVYARCA